MSFIKKVQYSSESKCSARLSDCAVAQFAVLYMVYIEYKNVEPYAAVVHEPSEKRNGHSQKKDNNIRLCCHEYPLLAQILVPLRWWYNNPLWCAGL